MWQGYRSLTSWGLQVSEGDELLHKILLCNVIKYNRRDRVHSTPNELLIGTWLMQWRHPNKLSFQLKSEGLNRRERREKILEREEVALGSRGWRGQVQTEWTEEGQGVREGAKGMERGGKTKMGHGLLSHHKYCGPSPKKNGMPAGIWRTPVWFLLRSITEHWGDELKKAKVKAGRPVWSSVVDRARNEKAWICMIPQKWKTFSKMKICLGGKLYSTYK